MEQKQKLVYLSAEEMRYLKALVATDIDGTDKTDPRMGFVMKAARNLYEKLLRNLEKH